VRLVVNFDDFFFEMMMKGYGWAILTKVVGSAMAPDEFSTLLRTVNVHRLHNIATVIGLVLRLADVYGSYVSVFVAVVLSMQNHCPEFPGKHWKYVSRNQSCV
jgi:hypothetical protein